MAKQLFIEGPWKRAREIAHGGECHSGGHRNKPGFQRQPKVSAGQPRDHRRGDTGADRAAYHAGSNRQNLPDNRHTSQQLAERLERLLPETAHEAIAGRIGEVQRAVADIGVAVPALRRERVLRGRIGGAEAAQHRVVDTAIHMYQANIGELLMAGEAARRLAGDTAGRIILAIGETALAPGIIREALNDGASRIGNGRNRPQMVLVEVSRVSCGIRSIDAHADHLAAGGEIIRPLHHAASAEQAFRHHAAAGEIQRLAGRVHLLVSADARYHARTRSAPSRGQWSPAC